MFSSTEKNIVSSHLALCFTQHIADMKTNSAYTGESQGYFMSPAGQASFLLVLFVFFLFFESCCEQRTIQVRKNSSVVKSFSITFFYIGLWFISALLHRACGLCLQSLGVCVVLWPLIRPALIMHVLPLLFACSSSLGQLVSNFCIRDAFMSNIWQIKWHRSQNMWVLCQFVWKKTDWFFSSFLLHPPHLYL